MSGTSIIAQIFVPLRMCSTATALLPFLGNVLLLLRYFYLRNVFYCYCASATALLPSLGNVLLLLRYCYLKNGLYCYCAIVIFRKRSTATALLLS